MPIDLETQLNEWRKSLLDTTKRNRLIKFVTGRLGGISLIRPHTSVLWCLLVRDGAELTFVWKRDLLGLPSDLPETEEFSADFDPVRGIATIDDKKLRTDLLDLCLRSPRLRHTDLLTDLTDRQLAARLLRLKRNSDEAQHERGVTTLFVTYGSLKWYDATDSTEEIYSPLLLLPVKLARASVDANFTLATQEDEILPNHSLAELLRTQNQIELPIAEVQALDQDDPACLQNYLNKVAQRVARMPRWEVITDSALGVFHFQKLAMWEDLGRNSARVMGHPVCRALAGDRTVSLHPPGPLVTAAELDERIPANTRRPKRSTVARTW
jgi:hypothetical protein